MTGEMAGVTERLIEMKRTGNLLGSLFGLAAGRPSLSPRHVRVTRSAGTGWSFSHNKPSS